MYMLYSYLALLRLDELTFPQFRRARGAAAAFTVVDLSASGRADRRRRLGRGGARRLRGGPATPAGWAPLSPSELAERNRLLAHMREGLPEDIRKLEEEADA